MIQNKKQNPIKKTASTQKKSSKKSLMSIFKNKKPKDRRNKKSNGGSVVKKIISVTASILLTIMLICFITGTIVVGAFAIYIKNYIDPVIEDFDLISTGCCIKGHSPFTSVL